VARLVTLIVVTCLAGLTLLVYVQLDAPVSRVLVSGELNDAQREQIRDAVRVTIDGGLLSADLKELKVSILALSWPRSVSVRRDWPGTLEIDVQMPMVIAHWQDAYLSSDGRIVKLPGGSGYLPVFDCRLADPLLAMEVFHRLGEVVKQQGLQITRLMENELGEWSLSLQHAADMESGLDMTVVLGAESMVERLDRFLIVYRKELSNRRNEIARVDARYDNGVAISWRLADSALVAAAVESDAGSTMARVNYGE